MKTRVRYYVLSAAALLLACTSVLGADYPTTVQSFSPLGYWRLNETGPSPALHSVANSGSLGATGNGYIVLDIGMGQSGANAVVGTAARFNNGGAAIGQCANKIDVPWNATLNPTTFTIEFWAKPNDLGINNGGISLCPISAFSEYGLSGAPRIGWLFYTSQTGGWQFRMGAASGSGYAAQVPSAPATTGLAAVGVWQHMAATFDGTTAKLYVNGVLIASGGLAVPWVPNPQMALRMGGTPLSGTQSDVTWLTGIGNTGNRGWDGWLDEVAVYSTALPQSTLAAHYDAAKPTGATNVAGYHAQVLLDAPVGYWGLDEAAVSAPAASSLPTAANSGSAGSAADGTNMWGSLAGQPGFNTPGLGGAANKATFMDGENGYIALKDAAALHFSGQVTMMAWVKVGAKDYFRNIIGRGWDTNVAETFLRVSMYDDGGGGGTQQNFYEVGVDDGSVNTYYDTAIFQIPAGDVGTWVHIAGTYDGSAWRLYRNGVQVASTTSSHGLLENFVGWTVGARWGPPSPTQGDPAFAASGLFFSGSIDEPAIFNTAISAANILAIYNSAAAPVQLTRTLVNPGTLFKGSSQAFNVWAEGDTDPIGYLWLFDGASTGVTATNYTATNLQNGTHTVSVVVTNVTSVAGSGTYPPVTNSVTFNVIPLQPTYTNQPVSITRYTGRPAFFSVVVGGSQPMTLRWQQNGVPMSDGPNISGTTTANLVLSNCAGLDGKQYSCISSNEANPGGFPNGVPSTTATLSVLAIPSVTAYAPAIIGDAPDAYWRLGESSGTVAHDYYNGHDGTYTISGLGNPGYSLLDPDTAASFNGLNSHVANINGTGATGGVNYQGHRNFSLEAWVNGPSGQQDGAAIICKGNGTTGTTATEQFSLEVSGGAYVFFTRGGGNAAFSAIASSGPDGTWQHVVGVYDDLNTQGGGTNLYIYVNGVQEGSGATRAAGLRASTDPVSIGSKRSGNDPNYDGTFNGVVDEVATYGYALTHAQVVDHYTDAYGTAYPPSIALQPQSASFYKTMPASLSVEAYGTQPLTYQWYHGPNPLSDNGIVTGSSTKTLKIDPVDTTDQGNYSVTINNTVGPPTNSQTVVLTVLALPTGPVDVSQLVMHLTFDGNLNDATGRGNNGTGMHVIPTNSVLHITGSTNTATPSGGNQDFKYVTISTGDGPPTGQGLHYASYTTNGDYASVIGGTAKTGGTTSTNAWYVSIGNRPDLVVGSNVNFSVAYWVRFPPWNGSGDLGDLPFLCSAQTSYGGQGYTFAPSYNSGGTGQGQKGGGWSYSLVNPAGSTVQLYGPNFVIDDGNWHHLAHTYNRVGLALTYVDGRQADTRSAAPAGDVNTGNTVSVGQDPTGSYPESGAYDIKDVGFWRRALTGTEVAGIYLAATNAGASFTGTYTAPGVTLVNIGGGKVQLTWPIGRLQSATTVTGPYTDVLQTNGINISPASSPYTNATTTKRFFRAFD